MGLLRADATLGDGGDQLRFNELTLGDPGEELHLRFHPELTILSGLGAVDRHSLADSIIDAIGGPAPSTLRFTGAADVEWTVGGPDENHAAAALGPLETDPALRRATMLLSAQDLGAATQVDREDEPVELREARAVLAELTTEVEVALEQQRSVDTLQADLDGIDHELTAAREGLARREYAQVLAQLERVRAEAAAIRAGSSSIDGDRQLLSSAEGTRDLAAMWTSLEARVRALTALLERAEELDHLDPTDRDRVAHIPAEPPADLSAQINEVRGALAQRIELDERIRELSVSKLPAPATPEVADLGSVDQVTLWEAAERVTATATTIQELRVSLGGLSIAGLEDQSEVIHAIEAAHARAEAAAHTAAVAKVPALVGIVVGIAVFVLGVVLLPVLIPVGAVGAAGSAMVGLLRPTARRVRASKVEEAALRGVEAPSYLAFHLRRVDASIDPALRSRCDAAIAEHRSATETWEEIVGGSVEVSLALALRAEIQSYNQSLQSLGDTAEEIEQLRRKLQTQTGPALKAAQAALVSNLTPYLMDESSLDDLEALPSTVLQQCELGAAARSQGDLEDAQDELEEASGRLEETLLRLGFDAGPLDARVGALEWAISRAAERETARQHARPSEEIQTDLDELQAQATRLRRPEWSAVTGEDAVAPSIDVLEANREALVARLDQVAPEVDLVRLSDRRAAVERRVASLEAKHLGQDASGQPGAVPEVQKRILDHLRSAATAGPDGDPVPVVLDEVLLQVPADRKWDVLDVLRRAARDQQLIYLTEDAFVAAWARQRALDGTITLLELAPEPVG